MGQPTSPTDLEVLYEFWQQMRGILSDEATWDGALDLLKDDLDYSHEDALNVIGRFEEQWLTSSSNNPALGREKFGRWYQKQLQRVQ